MYIQTIPTQNGMLFSWNYEQTISIWMKNTFISLDILWLNSKLEIVHMHHQATPFDLTPLTSPIPSQYVIELKAGTIKRIDIRLNDKFLSRSGKQ